VDFVNGSSWINSVSLFAGIWHKNTEPVPVMKIQHVFTGGAVLAKGLVIATVLIHLSSCRLGPTGKDNGSEVPEPHKYPIVELQDDFRQFREFLEESHPRMYRFTSRHAFDSLFDAQYVSIGEPMTAQEFYSILAPLTAAVGCGHTSMWVPRGFWDEAPDRMFPLGIHARDGQLYLVHSYSRETPVKFGSRILSVNGLESTELVNKMTGNISSDGFITGKRYQMLDREFPYLYALNYGFPEKFTLAVEEEGREREVTMEPLSRRLIRAYRESLVNRGLIREQNLVMEVLGENTALLIVRTFAYYDNVKGFKRFIDSSFQVVREHGITDLIIDLRGNDGGDPFCSTHLLSYLQNEPVVYFRYPYGRYARFNQPLPMAESPYNGRQYYLIDGMCFSSTGHFASILKYYELGTFIGEETGATFTCNDASHDTELKHTGWILQSARRTFAAAVTGFPEDQGILPDHPVRQSIEQVIANHDAVLEYTLELIRARENNTP
jgi:hypothetical protein